MSDLKGAVRRLEAFAAEMDEDHERDCIRRVWIPGKRRRQGHYEDLSVDDLHDILEAAKLVLEDQGDYS